ncbi:MAG: LPS export ABC transporter periplasmic protein LptC [Treponema sp.]|jgi:LPS export ABC transporter protein LptC|nr:LPS export ABC transporter periplasmic protein LptC [Treponema sp.]
MTRKIVVCICAIFLFAASCTFNYGDTDSTDDDQPDLIMDDVEYIRIRSADPIARFRAERAERFEKRRIMELLNFTFEQYGERGEEVNAFGKAGNASVDIDTGDISMGGGVRIDVESEDIIIETNRLEWKDEEKTLSTGESDQVFIFQENGTNFTGIGLFADSRRRTWRFFGNVGGTYIYDDEEDESFVEDEGTEQAEES